MTQSEILQKLKEGANFELEYDGNRFSGYGAINNFPECRIDGGMTQLEYIIHYAGKKKILESLPWSNTVQNPRFPRPEEYPSEDGDYITMLDCDEHKVLCNTFKGGQWLLYNRTHVKWWMPVHAKK